MTDDKVQGGAPRHPTAGQAEYAPPEQLRYAVILGIGIKVGFALLVLSFLAYVSGLIEPLIPLDQLPKYWGMPVQDFVAATGTPTGWGWITQVGKGDMLNLVGIAVLAGISILSSVATLPIFNRRRERAHVVISVLLVLVLMVAASGLLS